jgi:hypothetical protein
MIKLFYFILASILICNLTVSAQKWGYIVDDSSSQQVLIFDQGQRKNSLLCKFQKYKNSDTIEYPPDVLDEYGFEDGRVFFSKDVLIDSINKKYFLERLAHGKVNLYLTKQNNRKRFYLEKDSSLLELSKKSNVDLNSDFNYVLNDLINDCEYIKDAVRLVKYNKRSLSELINQYNECKYKPFPFFKYGINIGYSQTGITPFKASKDTLIKNSSFPDNKSSCFGIFLDYPLSFSNMTVHQKIYFQKNAFSYNIRSENIEKDIVINLMSINLPVLIRYTMPVKGISPFIDAGAIYTFNIRNRNDIYVFEETDNIIDIKIESDSELLTRHQLGYSLGAGLQIKVSYRNSIIWEVRYQKLYSLSIIPDTYNLNEFQIIAGFNF